MNILNFVIGRIFDWEQGEERATRYNFIEERGWIGWSLISQNSTDLFLLDSLSLSITADG